MKVALKTFFLFFFIICSTSSFAAKTINGIISDTNGIKIIRVWGTHEERGFAMGYLLAENIRDIYTGYMMPFMGKYIEALKEYIRIEKIIKIDKIYHIEARSMIAGMKQAGVEIANFDETDILLSNAFLDLIGLPTFNELKEVRKKFGCSSLICWGDATKNTPLNGKSVITRHLDWPANEHVVNNQVIVIHSPSEANEQKWLMIGFAGQISVLSGINKNGYAVFLHMLSDYDEDYKTLPDNPFEPLSFTLRDAIEKKDYNGDGKNNLIDIKDAIKSNPQGYAEGFIVSMVGPTQKENAATAAIAELTPSPPYIVFRDVNYSDDINGNNLYTANYSVKRLDKRNYCSRYLNVSKALGNGKLMSSDKCWEIMKEHSVLLNNIQFMQFIPELKTLKLSVYENGKPANVNKAHVFDLNALFK